MAYFTTLPVPKKGAKLTALDMGQLGVDLAAVTPKSLSAMPGSRDTAVIKLKVRSSFYKGVLWAAFQPIAGRLNFFNINR